MTAPPRSGDPALVSRARSGERAAFDQLVRANAASVYRTALAILGDEADAADATQDAFVSAWRGLSGLHEPERFDAWLARIVVNSCRQQLRRRGRVRIHEIAVFDDEVAASGSLDDGAAEADRFDRAFARLSADDRALLVLHHLEDRPVDELASSLGVAKGTVKSRLHRARAALEAALAKESR